MILSLVEELVIDFGDEEEDAVPEEAKDMIWSLLQFCPLERLGSQSTGGVAAVKEHPIFDEIEWKALLKQKAEFIPQLLGEEDTNYFDRKLYDYVYIVHVLLVLTSICTCMSSI